MSEMVDFLSEKMSEDGECVGHQRDTKYYKNCNDNDSDCCMNCWEEYLKEKLNRRDRR